jgi:molybdenum cofactor guanylyltransferase
MPHPAYILSGGRSSRFGSDKARYATPAGPQLLTLADQLRSHGHAVHVVADRADRYADLGITCLVDAQPDSGPLAGLASALEHHQSTASETHHSGWILLVSCDQRHWQPSWYNDLNAHANDGVDASIYYDTMWQPLPGLYHMRMLSTIIQRLQQRQLSLHGLLGAIEQRIAKVHTTQPPSDWSFNTLEDLSKPDA